MDNGALDLHKLVRTGQANANNYRQTFCDGANLPAAACNSDKLTLRLEPLLSSTPTTVASLNNGFNVIGREPFIMRMEYEHSFFITALNQFAPNQVLWSKITLFGEPE